MNWQCADQPRLLLCYTGEWDSMSLVEWYLVVDVHVD